MRLAIFDFDDTIVRGNSWQLFYRRELRRRPGRAPLLAGAYVLRRLRWWKGARFRDFALRGLRGLTPEEVRTVGDIMYRDELRARVRPAAREEIDRRRASGYSIVVATGAFDFAVAPFAEEIRADAVLATTLAYADGRCLGAVAGTETLGLAKAQAVAARFPAMTPEAWTASCAYTDSSLDAPLLALVGEPWFVADTRIRPAGVRADVRLCHWPDA